MRTRRRVRHTVGIWWRSASVSFTFGALWVLSSACQAGNGARPSKSKRWNNRVDAARRNMLNKRANTTSEGSMLQNSNGDDNILSLSPQADQSVVGEIQSRVDDVGKQRNVTRQAAVSVNKGIGKYTDDIDELRTQLAKVEEQQAKWYKGFKKHFIAKEPERIESFETVRDIVEDVTGDQAYPNEVSAYLFDPEEEEILSDLIASEKLQNSTAVTGGDGQAAVTPPTPPTAEVATANLTLAVAPAVVTSAVSPDVTPAPGAAAATSSGDSGQRQRAVMYISETARRVVGSIAAHLSP